MGADFEGGGVSKSAGSDIDHSLLCNADVKNEWSYTSSSYTPSCRGQGQVELYLRLHASLQADCD